MFSTGFKAAVFSAVLVFLLTTQASVAEAGKKKERSFCGLPSHIVAAVKAKGYEIGSRKPIGKPSSIGIAEWNRYLGKIKTCKD
jgi:hypothetical protein